MKTAKDILGRIFALWAIIIFVVGLLVVLLPIWAGGLIKEPKRTRVIFPLYRGWMAFFFFMTGVRRTFKGKENFRKGEAYVVVCNHRSLLDPPMSSPAIPGANKTIAKIEMARIPIFSVIYKGGSVLVDRRSEESRRASYVKMKEVLQMGMHMCIYPEGTRNKTKEPLQRFHDGAFKLAVESGKSIIPSLLFNTDQVFPRKTFFFWPHPVAMHFLPAVPSTGKSVQELKEEVFEIMKTYYVTHQKL